MGERKYGRRLHLDHRSPGDKNGGFRPLCPGCNIRRGNNQYSDNEVLAWIRRKWEYILPLRFLYWLNTSPGKGGDLERNEFMEKKLIRLMNE